MDAGKKFGLNAAIMILITIVIANLPPFGGITEYGMLVLAVFVAVIYGWFTLDLIWPSIYGFVAMAVLGIMPMVGALSAGIGHQTVMMLMMAMMFAGALEECGFSDMVGTVILRQPIFQKSPWLLVVGIFVAAFAMGVANAQFAAIILLWSVVGRIAQMSNIPKDDGLISFVNIFIIILGAGGTMIFPFYGQGIMMQGFYPIEINFFGFIVFVVGLLWASTLVTLLLAKVVFKLDASKFILPKDVMDELNAKTFTKQQKYSFVVFVVYLLALTAPTVIPNFPGVSMLSSLGIAGVSLVGAMLMALIHVDGKPLISIANAFRNHLQWPLFLLLAVTFPLADALKAPETGIFAAIQAFVVPIVSNMGVVPFVIIAVTALVIITQFAHNVILAAMFLPLLCPIIEQVAGAQWAVVLWMLIYVCICSGYCTPAASLYGGMIYGSESIHKSWAPKITILYTVLLLIVAYAIFIPLGLAIL